MHRALIVARMAPESAPDIAKDTLVDLLPATFVVDWAARVRREGDGAKILHGSGAAPTEVPDHIRWPADLAHGRRIDVPDAASDLLVAGCTLGEDEVIVIARRGGPEILDSEIARLSHLSALGASISR